MLPDLRLAVRHLRRAPGYTATAVLTFALAIGANSAIFSAVNVVLLRPLPVEAPGPGRGWCGRPEATGQGVIELTHRHMREWMEAGSRLHARKSDRIADNWNAVLKGRGEPTRIWFNGVSASFFETLGARPLLGRALRAEDDVPNAAPVAVLNHGTWVRRFGADPRGRRDVNGSGWRAGGNRRRHAARASTCRAAPSSGCPTVPALASGTPPNTANLATVGVVKYVVGRIRPGLRHERPFAAELDALEAQLDRDHPGRAEVGRPRGGDLRCRTTCSVRVRSALPILWAAVGVLLLIACGNVSGLMLTRVGLLAARARSAWRSARPAVRSRGSGLPKFFVVACAGGVFGLVFAYWLSVRHRRARARRHARIAEVSVDATVAFFTFAAVVAVAASDRRDAACARRAPRACFEAFEGERTTSSRHALRTRSVLLIAQIGLSVVLLVAAGLVVRSFMAVQLRQSGIHGRSRPVAESAAGRPGAAGHPAHPGNAARPVNGWIQDFLVRVRAAPGVEAAGAVYSPAADAGSHRRRRHSGAGWPTRDVRETLEAGIRRSITRSPRPATSRRCGSPLRAGRFFTDQDAADKPRVVYRE